MKLYAFWSYNGCAPHHLLGGEISKIRDNGDVEIVSYGPGFWFKPVKIVPLAQGLKIQAELDKLEEGFKFELETLKTKYKQEFKDKFSIFD